MTSTFKAGTAGCSSQSAHLKFLSCSGFSNIFALIFVLCLSDIPSESLSLILLPSSL